jgi:cytochrome c5
MTEAHDSHSNEAAHEGLIRTPQQLVLLVFFAFAVPIITFLLLSHLVASQALPSAGSNAMHQDEIVARIRPVAQVEVNANAASEPPAASAPAGVDANAAANAKEAMAKVAAAPAAKAEAGGVPALYKQVCAACHSTGVAGAPKVGDKAAWAPRLKLGVDGLTATAIKGIGAMPPRGGSTASDAEIKAVVEYMVHEDS